MKIKVKNYWFNIGDNEQNKKWLELSAMLQARGSKYFNVIADTRKGGNIPEEPLELEEDFIFENQVNAGNCRIFDWYGAIYQNRSIKSGHYIESGEGLDYLNKLRKEKFACGYCGKQQGMPKEKYCHLCLGSEYLKEDEIRLLELKAISDNSKRESTPPKELVLKYRSEQKRCRNIRLENQRIEAIERAKEEVKNAELEYLAKKWLVDHGFDFSNVIYYSHTKTFCFGWRNPITGNERKKLENKLKKFPYKYEIK